MSYSFCVSSTTKTGLKARVAVEMAQVVGNQHPHAKEALAVVTAAHALIDTQRDDAASYTATMYGSVSTQDWSDPSAPLTAASCNISVSCA